MTKLATFKRAPFIIIGMQAAAIVTTAVHPLMPLVLVFGVAGAIFMLYCQQPLLILLANEGFIRRTLSEWFPIFQVVDPVVLLVTILVFTLVLKLREPEVRRHLKANQYIIAAYLIWVVWMITASTYAPNAEWAVVKSLRFALFNTLLFLGPFILIHTRKESGIMLHFYLAYGLCVALFIIGQLLLRSGLAMSLENVARLSFLSANPIGVGRVLSICAAMSAILIIMDLGKKRLWGIAFAVFLIAAVLTGSRGPVLSLVAATGLLGMIISGKARRRTLLIMALLVAVAGLAMIIAPEGITYRYQLLLSTELIQTRQGLQSFNSITHRIHLWDMALSLWTQDARHFLLGDGTAGYARLFPWRNYRYPHNLPLEILVEYGLVGAWVFSLHIRSALKKIRQQFRTGLGREELMWLAALTTFFFSTLVSGDLDNNRFLWFFIGGLVSTISIKSRRQTEQLSG